MPYPSLDVPILLNAVHIVGTSLFCSTYVEQKLREVQNSLADKEYLNYGKG